MVSLILAYSFVLHVQVWGWRPYCRLRFISFRSVSLFALVVSHFFSFRCIRSSHCTITSRDMLCLLRYYAEVCRYSIPLYRYWSHQLWLVADMPVTVSVILLLSIYCQLRHSCADFWLMRPRYLIFNRKLGSIIQSSRSFSLRTGWRYRGRYAVIGRDHYSLISCSSVSLCYFTFAYASKL